MKKKDEQNENIKERQSKIVLKDNVVKNREIKCDNNEQYRRRSRRHIHVVRAYTSMVLSIMKMMILMS